MTVSPLHDTTRFGALADAVVVREIPFLGQLNLRLDAQGAAGPAVADVLGATLPTAPCTSLEVDGVWVLWLGPTEWLVLTPPGRAGVVLDRLRAALGAGSGAVTDVSAQRSAVEITGRSAAALLAKGCSLDLHPAVRGAGTCVQTLLARTGVIIAVRDDTATDFLLLVRASFARYLADWIADAAIELD